MHVRQLAWYSALPAKAKLTRGQQAEAEGMPLQLPPPGMAAYLVSHLFEIGPVAWAGMGEVPISHQDIAAWQANTGVQLDAWEARALRQLSGVYVDQINKSKEAACPAPWAPDAVPEGARAAVDRALRAALGALVGKAPPARRQSSSRNH